MPNWRAASRTICKQEGGHTTLAGQNENMWYVDGVKTVCRSCEVGRVRLLARRMELGRNGMGRKARAKGPELSTAEQARLPEWLNEPRLRVRTTPEARAQ